ncbi:hypothetical protein [Candidatus Chlorohelix sp.]|uniref:hypothetical protein n=1 Tax=Candidatus Chlorohelix sp. TaxID=3139201 RepID=UPI00306DA8AE
MQTDLKEPFEQKTASSKTQKPPSLQKRAGWALFWNIIFLPAKALLGLVVSLVIIKDFSRGAYINLAAISGSLALLGVLTDLGIERALPRFVSEIEVKFGRTYLRRFIFNIIIIKLAILAVLSLFFGIFADTVTHWLDLTQYARVYLSLILLLLVLGAFYDIATQILYSFFKQKVTNILDITVTIVNTSLTLIFILVFKWEVFGVIVALLLTTIVSVVIATWQAWTASQEAREIGKKSVVSGGGISEEQNLAEKVKLRWRFIKYSTLMYFLNVSYSLSDYSFAVVVLVYFREAVAATIVRIAYTFIRTLLKNLMTPLNGVQMPLFSSIYAEERHKDLQVAYATLTRIQIFLLVPSALGFIVLARNLLQLLMLRQSGEAVLTPDMLTPATWSVIITVIMTFGESLLAIPSIVLMVYEKYRIVIFTQLLPYFTGPLLVLVALFKLGAIVAVLVMGGLAVISRAIQMYIVKRQFGLRYPAGFFMKVLKASLAFAFPLQIIVLLLPVNWFVTFGVVAAGMITFVAVFKMLGGFDPEDKKRLQTIKLPFRNLVIKYL